jgi:hypothetical protein
MQNRKTISRQAGTQSERSPRGWRGRHALFLATDFCRGYRLRVPMRHHAPGWQRSCGFGIAPRLLRLLLEDEPVVRPAAAPQPSPAPVRRRKHDRRRAPDAGWQAIVQRLQAAIAESGVLRATVARQAGLSVSNVSRAMRGPEEARAEGPDFPILP